MYKQLTKYLYDLFLTSRKNNCNDLVVDAMAMMMYDARRGVREYTDEQTDIAALHADAVALDDNNQDLRMFIGRYNTQLCNAFKQGDREYFDKIVASCVARDSAE